MGTFRDMLSTDHNPIQFEIDRTGIWCFCVSCSCNEGYSRKWDGKSFPRGNLVSIWRLLRFPPCCRRPVSRFFQRSAYVCHLLAGTKFRTLAYASSWDSVYFRLPFSLFAPFLETPHHYRWINHRRRIETFRRVLSKFEMSG